MTTFLQRIICCLLIFTALLSKAQLSFTASVSPAKISKVDYAELRFTVENAKDVQQIIPPVLKDFNVVSGPNQASGYSSLNGNVKQYISVSYTIRPKTAGNFTIAPAQAKADGISLKSNAVRIEVSNASTGTGSQSSNPPSPFQSLNLFEDARPSLLLSESVLRKGEDAVEKVKQNIIVKAVVNKNSCYVGEPIVVTYKLYTRLKSESNLTQNPSFNGFSVIDLVLPDNVNYTTEKLNGKEYNVYTIRKCQLYPLQAGTIELEAAEVENNVHFIKEEYARRRLNAYGDLYDAFGEIKMPAEAMEDHKVTLRSTPILITVNPLPENNKPATFKSAVGKFEISGVLDKDTFSTDDAGKFLVLLKGEGNLQMINAPEVSWSAGFEVFDAKVTDDLNKLSVPVSGRKLFEFPFTVTNPGNYTIPATTISFFDPASRQYRSASTKAINFTVTKGTGKSQTPPVASSPKEQFLNKIFNNRWMIVVFIGFLIIAGLLIWLFKENKKDKQKAIDAAAAEEVKAEEKVIVEITESADLLQEPEEHLGQNNSVLFYQSLNNCLKNYLLRWLQLTPEILNKKNIAEQLDKKGVATGTAIEFQQLLDEVEWQLYTPVADENKMNDIFERSKEMLDLLNSYQIRYQ